MTDSKSLRERVAKAIASVEMPLQHLTLVHFKAADAAIAIVLEEAAKVAEAFPARTHGNLATAPYAAAEQAGDEIAAAIRKLGDKEAIDSTSLIEHLRTENEKLRAALELYREAVRIDATMERPKFMAAYSSALKRAWDADRAALEEKR